jgi:hypothetical protein
MKKITQLSNEELLAQMEEPKSDLEGLSNEDLIAQIGAAEEPSVKTMGTDYFKAHPFKSFFEPISKTMTGKSLEDKARDNIIGEYTTEEAKAYKKKWGTYPDFYKENDRGEVVFDEDTHKNPLKKAALVAKSYISPTMGRAADTFTAPASVVPIPGAKYLGKIPVGSTNLGRISSNVAVGKGFKQGVKDLQALETHLQKIGKTSSPGIRIGGSYNPAANQAIMEAHNAINTPSASKFKQRGDFDTRDSKIVEGYTVLNDFAGQQKPKSVEEALDLVQNAKGEVYRAYTSQANLASREGAMVDLADVAKKQLEPLLANEQIKTHRKGIIKAVEGYIADFKRRGKVSLDEAQKDLETLNKDIGKFIKSGSPDDQNVGAVKLALSQEIRKRSDEAIQEAIGQGGYQVTRKKYGAIREVEDELIKAYAKKMKPNKGVANAALDVMTGVDLAKAIIGNAVEESGLKGGMLAAANQAVKKGLQWKNSPDRYLQKIFKTLEGAKQSPRERTFILPQRGGQDKTMGAELAGVEDIGGLYAEPIVTNRPARAQYLPPRDSRTSMAYAKGESYVPQGVQPNPKRIEKGSIIKQGKLLNVKLPKVKTNDEYAQEYLSQPWYRGDSPNNGGEDLFSSASKNTADGFGKVRKLDKTELPKKPLLVESKESLIKRIGYNEKKYGNPLEEGPDVPADKKFDYLAKQYAKKKGYDGIIYENGTFEQPELVSFNKGKVKSSPDPYGFLRESKSQMKGNSGQASIAAVAATGATGASFISSRKSKTSSIPDEDVLKSVLGEAEDQGEDGMKMLASALRNRGHLKGVYGHRAIIKKDGKYYRQGKNGLRRIDPKTVMEAKKAVEESKSKDYSNGADHWEGTRYKVPSWAKDMEVAGESKSQRFYRPKRKPALKGKSS